MRTSPKEIHGSKLDLDDSSDEEFPDGDLFAAVGEKEDQERDQDISSVKASATIEDWHLLFLCACSLMYLSLS